jgi:hypothetical protein
MLRKLREYENLHVALWLLKDTCWVLSWKIPGMIMIVPTILIAMHITWRSRKNTSDLMHNIAVTLWICANGTWMAGEFFCDDCTRPYAIVFFLSGISVVSYYYIFLWRNRHSELDAE